LSCNILRESLLLRPVTGRQSVIVEAASVEVLLCRALGRLLPAQRERDPLHRGVPLCSKEEERSPFEEWTAVL